jgi:hypothetical protein
MSMLCIDEPKLKALREYAEAHPIPAERMACLLAGRPHPAVDWPAHRIELPVGFTVTYAVEELPLRSGSGAVWMRHMAIRTARPGRYPTPIALELVGESLGFPPLEECLVRPDPASNAIDVLAPWEDYRPPADRLDSGGPPGR